MTVLQLVERERHRLARVIAVGGAAAALGLAALILAVGVMVLGRARWIELPRGVPLVFWLLGLAAAAALVWATRRLLTRDTSVAGLARAVEEEQRLRAGSLRGALEVAQSGAFGRRAAERMAERLEVADRRTLAPSLRQRVLRRTLAGVAAGLIGAVLLVERSSAAPDGWRAIAHPVRAWSGTLLPKLALVDAPRSVLRGERVSVTVFAPDRREVQLASRSRGAAWRTQRVVVDGGRARVTLGPVDADLAIVADDGRSASDTALVRVVDRPFIGDVSVRALFPSYLGRAEETLPTGEPARVPQGTVLSIEGQSSTELASVTLVRDGAALPLSVAGRHFSGRLQPTATGRYTWRAAGAAGEIGDVPAPLEVEVVPDSAPRVEIVAPSRDTTVAPGDTVPLALVASDDHGLASVVLRAWRKTARGQAMPPVARTLAADVPTSWSGETALALAAMGLVAGDEVHLVAVGVDGSPWRQAGQSRELVLRVPGLREQRESARALADSAIARAQAAARAEKALAQKTQDAAKARQSKGQESKDANGSSKGQSMSYESAEQAKQLANEQKELADRVQQLQNVAKQLERQLKQAGALDSGLQARMREVQKLLQEALTPELQKQLDKLNQAAQNLNSDEARRAMGDLAQQQQKMREQLEKSVEMLKRAALEGSMQTLKDEAKDVAKQQRQIADSMERSGDAKQRQQAKQDAKDVADRSRELSKDIEELQKRLEQERARSGAERVEDAEQSAKASTEAMQRASREAQQQRAEQQRADQQQRGQNGEQQGAEQRRQSADAKGAQRDSAQQGEQRGQQQSGEQKAGQQQSGEQKAGQQQSGQQQSGQSAQGQQQSGQKQGGQQQGGQQQSGQQQAGQQGQQQSGQQQGDKSASAAREAADAMERAAQQLSDARDKQIGEWKKELTSELDQSIQEMLQLARQQDALEQQVRQGADKTAVQAQQSALQQGVDKAAQRLGDAGQKSSLLSQRSQRSVGDARKKVEQATRELADARSAQQAASSMRDASEALNQAAASLVRDRETAKNAQSASGFSEMMQQLQQMAKQQGSLNAQSMDLMPKPGSQMDQQGRDAARRLAEQQRGVAEKLDDVGDMDRTGKAEELAKEARQLAQALEQGQVDRNVIERQQRLFRRMLDAGRTLEKDERDEEGKREARTWTGSEVFAPPGAVSSKAASKFELPTWADLRGLSPEERRMVLEYFKRINAERP